MLGKSPKLGQQPKLAQPKIEKRLGQFFPHYGWANFAGQVLWLGLWICPAKFFFALAGLMDWTSQNWPREIFFALAGLIFSTLWLGKFCWTGIVAELMDWTSQNWPREFFFALAGLIFSYENSN